MDNYDRFKRGISSLELEDDASKRRRLLGALGSWESNAASFLSRTADALVSPASARLPSLAFSLPSAAQNSYVTNNSFRQHLPQPPNMASALQQAALDEVVLGNLGAARRLSSAATQTTTSLRELLRAKEAAAAQEAQKQAILIAKREEEIAERLLAQRREETKKQVARLLNPAPTPRLNDTSSVAALLRSQAQASSLLPPREASLNRNLSNLISPASRATPWSHDDGEDIDARITQMINLPTFRIAKSVPDPKTTSAAKTATELATTAADLRSYSQWIQQSIDDSLPASGPAGAPPKDLKTPRDNAIPPLQMLPPNSTEQPMQCLPIQTKKEFSKLGTEEDSNWLSEMHCFLRSEIVEVFHVENSKLTGRSTSKGLSAKQVGIRCRFCADMPPESRVSRSSAFPSSLRQLYQSFTMMVRDHFGPHNMCTAIPPAHRDHLNHLRHSRNSQGASDSKHYWVHAAHKIGMVDNENGGKGIHITPESKAKGKELGNFGAPADDEKKKPEPVVLLVQPDDIPKGSMFLYSLLLQTQMVRLQKSELVAKRRTLTEGLEGIGCRHCCTASRYGFSRRFPLRRRSLPEEIMDMYCHMKRCPLCPKEVKELLDRLHAEHERAKMNSSSFNCKDGRGKDPHRDFYDAIWQRLGRTHDIKT